MPFVAIRNVEDKRTGKPIKAYDSKGDHIELSYTSDPEIPILVIKDNERVIKINDQNFSEVSSLISVPNNSNYVLMAPLSQPSNSDKSVSKNASITPLSSRSIIKDERTNYAVQKELNTQRDYVYYGIDSTENITKGTLNEQYAEHIVAIQMENEAALNKASDFTEGNLEFVISVLIPNRDGNPIELKKIIFCEKTDLKSPIIIRNGQEYGGEMIPYSNFNPIELTVWDNYQHGNTWTFAAYEHDDGTETTITNNISTSFTTGISGTFNFEQGKLFKFGATTNNSVTSNSSATITTKRTNTHDDLGSGILRFWTPVGTVVNTGRSDRIERYWITTGAIKIHVQPIKRY